MWAWPSLVRDASRLIGLAPGLGRYQTMFKTAGFGDSSLCLANLKSDFFLISGQFDFVKEAASYQWPVL
jgi:hypothetical protein